MRTETKNTTREGFQRFRLAIEIIFVAARNVPLSRNHNVDTLSRWEVLANEMSDLLIQILLPSFLIVLFMHAGLFEINYSCQVGATYL